MRLRGAYGSPEFMRSYRAANGGGVSLPAKDGGAFADLWHLYRTSPTFAKLAPGTKAQQDQLMRVALERAGNQPVEAWTRKFIIASCDARSKTPGVAHNFLKTLKAMFKWALSREHIEVDPTVGVRVERPKTDGLHAWTADELSRFELRWPLGTRERLAYDIMLWTGLRRGDAARVGPHHVKDGSIVLDTAKTGQRVTVRIMEPLLQSIRMAFPPRETRLLKDGVRGHNIVNDGVEWEPAGKGMFRTVQALPETFITREDGKPMVKGTFGNWFGAACKKAGVPGSAHGLRKALAIRLAESGATPAEMDALMGWSGGGMSSLYARKASREKLAEAALERLGK